MSLIFSRPANTVMNLARLGSMYESCFSFTHLLVRHMAKNRWQTNVAKWELNPSGHGTVIYELKTPTAQYSTVIFSNNIEDENRDERVIATEWDITFALVKGTNLTEHQINDLRQNVPKQEKGRYNEAVLVLSRANKSVRMFQHVLERLSIGEQPDLDLIKQVGYIVRTTAVYGNGKFGIADFEDLLNTADFDQSYRAQMYAVYVVRHFSIQWMEWLAQQINPGSAVPFTPEIKQCLGIGNSTGLGMAPYLLRHPRIIDHWLSQRENALTDISALTPSPNQFKSFQKLLHSATTYLQQTITIDETQRQLNQTACTELQRLLTQLAEQNLTTWHTWLKRNETLSFNAQELFISALLEVHFDIAEPYANQMNVPELLELDHQLSISDFIRCLEQQYPWALGIDFSNPDSTHWLWYQSKNKQEPRLGVRSKLTDVLPHQELPMDVAKQIHDLYQALTTTMEPSKPLSDFLLNNDSFSSITKRVCTLRHLKLGEIQANMLSKDTLPLNLLRAKLSFYGASKFDPRSDRWLRVTFFQGAPMLNEQGRLKPTETLKLFATLPANVTGSPSATSPLSPKVNLSSNEMHDYGIRALQSVCMNTDTVGISNAFQALRTLGLLSEALPVFECFEQDLLRSLTTRSASEHHLSIDLNQRSLIYHMEMFLDYAVNKVMIHHRPFYVDLRNARNPAVCLGSLFNLLQKQHAENKTVFFKASYTDQGQQHLIINDIDAIYWYTEACEQPRAYFLLEVGCLSWNVHDSNYVLKAKFDRIPSIQTRNRVNVPLHLWEKIQQHAAENFVPITEQSESEAGGKA